MLNNEFEYEKEKLQSIIKKFNEVIKYYDLRLEALPRIYRDNPKMLEYLFENYTEKLKLMERNIEKPYFARIDFLRDGEENSEQLYIGKVGVMDEENQIITVDWRAPVSSMYYDSNIGNAYYEAPEGKCSGKLLVKRQFNIEKSELIDFQDVDTVSNDELLKPYLGMSTDKRLKNIVSTIQSEQNSIIREKISENIIVQGVAGSGKTTVALHRIAYLVYNNRNIIKPEQYLVVGPNKFFVDYISGVLPDLDVNNVMQLTYDELCANFIDEKIHLIREEEKLMMSVSNLESLKYEKLKVSMRFKEALDCFIEEFDKNVINNADLEIKGYKILDNSVIKDTYYSISSNVIYNTIQKKIERCQLELRNYIQENFDDIEKNIKLQFSSKIVGQKDEIKIKESSNLTIVQKELKNNCLSSLKKYFSNKIPKTTKCYYQFLVNISKYIDETKIRDIKDKIKNNLSNIKNGNFEFEDLSSLIYLKTKLNGVDEYNKYRQIAIDEAQDYGEFSFYALKSLLNNASFSIFGDLAQSIYQYRGIRNWDEVLKNTFQQNCQIKYLLKSYRTTTEIMNEANYITQHLMIDTAQPVIRHGKNVGYKKYDNKEQQIEIILQLLLEYQLREYKSIAIICKDDKETEKINSLLNQKSQIEIRNIVDSQTKYEGGICTITSYLAKGLEFDGVIIADASEEIYNSTKDIDMKLLYVSMTRALHELTILYKGQIVKPLYKEGR